MPLCINLVTALSSHLLTGLDDFKLIKNPREVYQELVEHSALSTWSPYEADHSSGNNNNNTNNNNAELIEIELAPDELSLPEIESLDANRLPNLIGTSNANGAQQLHGDGYSVAAHFVCRCPILEIDLQRALYCERMRQQKQRLDLADNCDLGVSSALAAGQSSPETFAMFSGNETRLVEIELPDCESQLRVFGRPSRNQVAKRLQLAKRIRRASASGDFYSLHIANDDDDDDDDGYADSDGCSMIDNENNDLLSLGLYKLEELLREVTVNLRDNLSEAAKLSGRKLGRLLEAGAKLQLSELYLTDQDDLEPVQEAMIRAPVARRTMVADKAIKRRLELGRESGDSGIEPDKSFEGAKWLFGALDWHVKLRSSDPIQTIVAYSISLFAKLVEGCPLFSLIERATGERKVADAVGGSGGKTKKKKSEGLEGSKLLSLADLKLFACVECQKMRATIRYKWISKCLLLAFGHHEEFPTSANLKRANLLKRASFRLKAANVRSLNMTAEQESLNNGRLPTVDSQLTEERLIELKYLDLLALVMGQLLRRHFVEVALERWCRLLANAQFLDVSGHYSESGASRDHHSSAAKQRPKLLVQVELVEVAANKLSGLSSNVNQLLACSQADEQLKQTMAFVVDEIASVCTNLPRLESQLESKQIELTQWAEPGSHRHSGGIFVLQNDDELLVKTKIRLETLIERSLPINIFALNRQLEFNSSSQNNENKQQQQQQLDDMIRRMRHESADKWNDQDYLIVVELVNRFRNGTIASLNTRLVERIIADWPLAIHELDPATDDAKTNTNKEETSIYTNDRLKQLQLSCQQIRLLNSLEMRLNCCLSTFYDFGFVMLDCEPLRKSLIGCVQKERNLLVRLNLDDLLKLMERLRLQFDEIELGLDLEAAIEDYLAEKWQAKHRELPEQQLILTGGDNINDADDDDDEVNLDPPFNVTEGADQYNTDVAETASKSAQQAVDDDPNLLGALTNKEVTLGQPQDENEEFINALTSGNVNTAQTNQQLLALRGAANSSKAGGQILAAEELVASFERRVAPLIECQLLVGRYNYLSKLLNKELEPLVSDLEVSFEGLMFLSEFVGHDQLEPSHSDLISELLVRSQEFTNILSESLNGLDRARLQLIKLNDLRRQVLSKLVVEFHLLMVVISRRRLVSSTSNATAPDNTVSTALQQDDFAVMPGSTATGGLNIRQLDSIQEASDWAQKLEVRFDFLRRQNCLLTQEHMLLSKAKLTPKEQEDTDQTKLPNDDLGDNQEAQLRSIILDRWHLLVAAIASLWLLAEDYETQQVKWLNSDIKRIDFAQIDSTFNRFQYRLDQLRDDCKQLDELQHGANEELRLVLFANLNELQARLDLFATKRIPIFMFLTNKYLTAAHWNRLTNLLDADKSRTTALADVSSISPQACTTLAQFLELNVDNHVTELVAMNEDAISEHQLTMFLLTEAAKSAMLSANGGRKMVAENGVKVNLWQLDVSTWLENWSDQQLIGAANRFIETKLIECSSTLQEQVDCSLLGSKLIACHSLTKRYLSIVYTLDLESSNEKSVPKSDQFHDLKLTIRSNNLLTSSALIRPALFVEFMRLFTENWIKAQIKLATKIGHHEKLIKILTGHLNDIQCLVERVKQVHRGDLHQASVESEQMLAHLEQQTIKLELEREILATKEAQAVEQQRTALITRDECIRQITERAIPAIRAATKALDCLDEKSLRFLRCLKPSPPEPIRLVIEAVCLLRSCAVSSVNHQIRNNKYATQIVSIQSTDPRHHQKLEPERHFDAVRGLIIEDYWPVASRMLIGTHSSRFVSDLRRVDKKTIPASVMHLIRRRYLSSNSFNVRLIENVSRECALLAKWLIAVDVFDRVINVVRPNYHAYMESEKNLSQLLFEVDDRRREIEAIGIELQQMEDSFEIKVGHKMALVDSLDQCKDQLKRMEGTRLELTQRRLASENELAKLKRKRRRLANRCLMRAAKTVYVEAMRKEEQKPMINLLKLFLSD